MANFPYEKHFHKDNGVWGGGVQTELNDSGYIIWTSL